jgi:hypothetical protein
MKSLDDIPGAWDRKLSSAGGCASARFSCVLAGEGVLDRETGIVWERRVNAQQEMLAWADAIVACAGQRAGGRLGWRLPTASELLSLIDAEGALVLPAGNPFVFAFDGPYWSATTDATNGGMALTVSFSKGAISDSKTIPWHHLCIRSGEDTGRP